jgi:hypothetical protein
VDIFFSKVICHVLKQALVYAAYLLQFSVNVHEVGQEMMKITKSLAMEVNKSFFILNKNKQDGNKT